MSPVGKRKPIEPVARAPQGEKAPWSLDQWDRRLVALLMDNPAATPEELGMLLCLDPADVASRLTRPVLKAEVEREQRDRIKPIDELIKERKVRFFMRATELVEQNENVAVAADMVKFLLKNDLDALAPPKKLAVGGDRDNPLKVLIEVIGSEP